MHLLGCECSLAIRAFLIRLGLLDPGSDAVRTKALPTFPTLKGIENTVDADLAGEVVSDALLVPFSDCV